MLLAFSRCSETTTAPAPISNDAGKCSISDTNETHHIIWGIWNITFDPSSNSVTILPSRNLEAHYNLTKYVTPPECDDCLGITVTGFNPDGWVYDVKVSLRNPTQIAAYDVRGTLLIGAPTDKRRLVNADEFTELFDDSDPPDRNPFKAFATDQPGRKFLPGAIHEVLYQVSIPPPPNFNVKFVIDGSWPKNQKEPYRIYNQEATGELNENGEGIAEVVTYVSDWQGDVESVKLDISPLGAPGAIDLEHIAGDKWSGQITNEYHAPAGEYELWLEAKSTGCTIITYDKLLLTITPYINTPPEWDDTIGIVSAAPGNNKVLITYGKASDPDAPVTYNVYCSEATPVDFASIPPKNDPDGSPYIYDSLENGKTYYFAVRAMDGLGLEDDNTNELPATPQYENQPPTWDGPIGVQSLKPLSQAMEVGFGTASDPDSPVTYNVYYSETSPIDFDTSPFINAQESPGVVSSLQNGLIYHFAVRAIDSLGLQDDNIVELAGDPNLPPEWDDTIGIVSATPGDGKVTVDFGTASDPDAPVTYNVYYSMESPIDFGTASKMNFAGAPAVIEPLPNGVEFFFAVRAMDALLLEDTNTYEISATPQEPQYEGWGVNWGSDSLGVIGYGMGLDNEGDIYVSGQFTGTVDFDPDPMGEDIHTAVNYDAFLSKFAPNGDFLWVHTWGGGCAGWDLAADFLGNVYVTGYFAGDNDFDPGPAVDQHHQDEGSLYGAFLSKFDVNGNYQWVRTWGGTNDIIGIYDGYYSVATDGFGDIYVTGHYVQTTDFDPGPGEDWHTPVYGLDIFLTKFNSDGDFQWARTWGGLYSNMANLSTVEGGFGVAVDSADNVYVAGTFGKTVDFDPDPVGVDEHTSAGSYAAFLSKFDSTGDFQWARTWDWYATGIAVDGDDMIYVAGREPGGCGFRKYNSNGDFIWSREWTAYAAAFNIDTDLDGNASIVGYFTNTVDFNPDPGEVEEHTTNSMADIYISRFDPIGDFLWVRTWGGFQDDEGYAVAMDNSGVTYLTGAFISDEFDFDPGPGVEIHSKISYYGPDTFLFKLLQDGYW